MKDLENSYFKAKIPDIENHTLEEDLRGRLIKHYNLNKSQYNDFVRAKNRMRLAYTLCSIMFIVLSVILVNPQYALKVHNYTFREEYSFCDQIEEADSLVKVVEAEYYELEEEDIPAKYIVEKYVSKELGAVTYIKDPNKIENLYKSL